MMLMANQFFLTGYQKQAGSGWSTQFPITPVKTTPFPDVSKYILPQMGSDDAGNAVAAWVDMDTTSSSSLDYISHVYVRNYNKVTGWSAPILMQSNPAEYATAVNLTVLNDGTAWVVWTERTIKAPMYSVLHKGALFAAKYSPLSGWGSPEKVTDDYLMNFIGIVEVVEMGARIAADRSGNPVVVWVRDLGAAEFVLYSTNKTAGVWGAPVIVAPAQPNVGGIVHSITDFDIAMDGDGNAIAVWTRLDPTGFINTVYSNRFTVEAGWGGVTIMPSVTTQHSFSPKLAMDGLGNAFLLWVEYDGSAANAIWAARFDRVLGWQPPVIISSPSEAFEDSSDPQLEFDAFGNAVAVWSKYDALLNRTIIRACRYDRNTGWGVNKTISNGNGIARKPQLAVSGSGRATAIWYQYDFGIEPWRIWSNDFTP